MARRKHRTAVVTTGTWPESSKWSTKTVIPEAHACSYADKSKGYTIYINEHVSKAIASLCSEVKLEWQLMLIGTEDGMNVRVTDYYVPKQAVTSASVRNDECIDIAMIERLGIIATIHSHGNMTAFESGTDHHSTNMPSQIKHHMTTNNKSEYFAQSKTVLPCGMVKMTRSFIKLEQSNVIVAGIEKIVKHVYQYLNGNDNVGGQWMHTPNNAHGYTVPEPDSYELGLNGKFYSTVPMVFTNRDDWDSDLNHPARRIFFTTLFNMRAAFINIITNEVTVQRISSSTK